MATAVAGFARSSPHGALVARKPGDPVRVLLVTEREPDACALGGVEVHVADLAASLEPGIQPFGAHLRAGRLIVESLGPRRRELAALPAGDLAGALETALLALDVDVLHVHSPQIGADDLARAARAAGAPVALTLHDVGPTRFDASALVDALRIAIAPSRFIRDAIAEAYPRIRDVARVLPWGVPPQAAVPVGAGGRLRVAFVGVLAADKGAERIPDLVRACGHLGVEWHLFGATEGRSLRAIRREAPGLRAHGSYRRPELGRRLARARVDLVVLASVVPESFCMTLDECLAARVPVLASDIGALGERVRDLGGGWTFDPWQPATFAAAMEGLADRRQIAAVKRWLEERRARTPRDMAADHATVYRELATGRVPADPQRRRAATARFGSAPAPAVPALRRGWRMIRRSRLYRELPLRRLLPEAVRGRIERRAAGLLQKLSR